MTKTKGLLHIAGKFIMNGDEEHTFDLWYLVKLVFYLFLTVWHWINTKWVFNVGFYKNFTSTYLNWVNNNKQQSVMIMILPVRGATGGLVKFKIL